MTTDQCLTISTIFLTLTLFIWGKLRYDIVALIALFSCAIFGLIPIHSPCLNVKSRANKIGGRGQDRQHY